MSVDACVSRSGRSKRDTNTPREMLVSRFKDVVVVDEPREFELCKDCTRAVDRMEDFSW